MDRATHLHSALRRMLSLLATFAFVGGTLLTLTPGADAASNSCRARNITQDGRSDSNLQAVIDAASAGDTIAVKYVCVGNFQVSKKLTLVGEATAGRSKAVLSARDAGRVLLISARVTLTNLKVTRPWHDHLEEGQGDPELGPRGWRDLQPQRHGHPR
jgi:hypothetical protein